MMVITLDKVKFFSPYLVLLLTFVGLMVSTPPVQGQTNPPPAPAPTLSVYLSRTFITVGESTNFSWSSTNVDVDGCLGSLGSTYSASGSFDDLPFSTRTYTLTCTGPGGSITKSATVIVDGAPPSGCEPAPTFQRQTLATIEGVGGSSYTVEWASNSLATSCTLDRGTGSSGFSPVPVDCTGSITENPSLPGEYSYRVVATGHDSDGNTVTTLSPTITVSVNERLTIGPGLPPPGLGSLIVCRIYSELDQVGWPVNIFPDECHIPPGEALPQCSDGHDNDGDRLIDGRDPGCHSNQNASNPLTYDPDDNSEDNSIVPLPSEVCTQQGGTWNGTSCDMPACRDGLDNDGDGLKDLNDPGCTSGDDTDESSPSCNTFSAYPPALILPNNTTKLSWNCTPPTLSDCHISDNNANTTDFGPVNPTGNRTTQTLSKTTIFTLSCSGDSITKSVTVRLLDSFLKEVSP